MRGYGSHRQPPGTWSDDSSLLLCTIDSLLRHTFDTEDMGKRVLQWRLGKLWTPHGQVFDIGIATSKAIQKISEGVRAESAGGDTEYSNGNGSLMRIIPVALRFAASEIGQALEYVHRSSAITHRHPRSQIACGLFTLLVRELLTGAVTTVALQNCLEKFHGYYGRETWWATEFDEFSLILKGDLGSEPESAISSDGYVVDTLTASIWCLLTTRSFEECVLKAVNLGGDIDTTGCVAGGLAGVYYGVTAIRKDWMKALARSEEMRNMFDRFADICRE
jgi:ADP-ribosylglycohydrolase